MFKLQSFGRRRYGQISCMNFPKFSLKSSLRSFSSYSNDETDAKDDDEFIFPIPVIMNSTVEFHWSGAEITRHFNLASTEFHPKKEIIYNKKDVKMVKVTHNQEGVMTFTLLKDQNKTWKICNIFKFGDSHSQPEYSLSPTRQILSGFLTEITCQDLSKDDSNILVNPYQYINPPYSFKNVERISNFLKLPSPDSSFEFLIDSRAPQKVLVRSSDQVLLETHLQVKNSVGITHSIIDLLLLIVNAETPEEQIACVIVGGEKVRGVKQ